MPEVLNTSPEHVKPPLKEIDGENYGTILERAKKIIKECKNNESKDDLMLEDELCSLLSNSDDGKVYDPNFDLKDKWENEPTFNSIDKWGDEPNFDLKDKWGDEPNFDLKVYDQNFDLNIFKPETNSTIQRKKEYSNLVDCSTTYRVDKTKDENGLLLKETVIMKNLDEDCE